MKKIVLSTAVFLALCLPQLAHAVSEVETGAVTQPFAGLYYNPTGIAINGYLYIYVQGINAECQTALGKQQGDVIDAFRAPLQADGTPGTFVKVGRISPCAVYPPNPSILASFGPGQIFKATWKGTTAYHLLADMSDFFGFYEIWHGWTTDGLNWTWEVTGQSNCTAGQTCADPVTPGGTPARTITWKGVSQPLLSIDPSLGRLILNPVMMATNGGINNAEWWGYLKYWDGQFNTTGMRVLFDANGNPSVYLQSTLTAPFGYAQMANNRITSTSQLLPLIPGYNAKSLLNDSLSGVYQLWGSANVSGIFGQWVGCAAGYTTSSVVTCQSGNSFGCPVGNCLIFGTCQPVGTQAVAFDSNTYTFQVGQGFYWYQADRFSLGTQQGVGSLSRYLPSGYSGSRDFPFRWNASNGKRFLFSSTSDAAICSKFAATPYIVKSEIVRQ